VISIVLFVGRLSNVAETAAITASENPSTITILKSSTAERIAIRTVVAR
jgi:hypothetical protein